MRRHAFFGRLTSKIFSAATLRRISYLACKKNVNIRLVAAFPLDKTFNL